MSELWRKLLFVFRRRRFDRELKEEMRFHLEMKAQDTGGDAAARYAAQRQFGNSLLLREASREAWGWVWLETLLRDVRFGLRMMLKNPGFTAVAVTSLALGIGGNTAIFSLLDAILLRSLPIRKPDELVLVRRADRRESVSLFSYPAYRELRGKCGSFTGLLAFSSVNDVTVRGAGMTHDAQSEGARAQLVSDDFFPVLGVRALIGRTLGPDDNRVPGGRPVAVISHGYWKRRWSSDPNALQQRLTVNGVPFTIVGVTPPEFFGVEVGRLPEIWIPIMMQGETRFRGNSSSTGSARPDIPWPDQPDMSWLTAMGRLKPGTSVSKAAAEANVLFRQLESARGRLKGELRIELTPGGRGISELRRRFSEPLQILMSMVGVVLLVACANVANLLLARAAARRHEIAVRLAIGAGRWRLVRQLLTESALLALAGGALGLLFGDWGRSALMALVEMGFGALQVDVPIDLRVLTFTAVLSLATGILFGLAPAVQATSPELGVTASRSPRLAASRLFVVAQVALSLLLVIGAGLFVRTLRNLETLDTGYRPEDLLLAEIEPGALGYGSAQLRDLYDRLPARVQAIPGVRKASLSLSPPVSGSTWVTNVSVAGYTPRPDEDLNVHKMVVTPGYFEAVGLPVIEGRALTARDTQDAPPVAVINQTMARYFFGDRSAVGRRFGFYAPLVGSGIEIVGVVHDAIYNRVRDRIPPMVYLPVAQEMEVSTFNGPTALGDLEVRTAPGAGPAVAAQLRRAIAEANPKLPVDEILTLRQRVERSVGQERALAQLTGFFGGLALILASIGLYGVMSYAVARRISEIGVRLALGALPVDVRCLVLRETLALAAAGIALGLPAALGLTRFARTMLFGLKPNDPVTMSAAVAVMVTGALLAGSLPAWRASRIDPMEALRYE